MDMNLEQQLRAALAPQEPGAGPMNAVLARLSSPRANKRRGGSRSILFGTVLVVAAAASMLALQLLEAPAPQAGAAAPIVSIVGSAEVEGAVAAPTLQLAVPRPAA